jgi:hypothetical protein
VPAPEAANPQHAHDDRNHAAGEWGPLTVFRMAQRRERPNTDEEKAQSQNRRPHDQSFASESHVGPSFTHWRFPFNRALLAPSAVHRYARAGLRLTPPEARGTRSCAAGPAAPAYRA